MKREQAFMKLSKSFIQGLAVILPTVITLYIIYWFGAIAEYSMGTVIKLFLPDRYYVPGLGLLTGLLMILAIGILMNLYLVQKVYALYENILERVPFIKSLYGALSDLMSFFSGEKGKSFNQVAMVNVAPEINLLGFITRDDFSELPEGIGEKGIVAVYLPMSYQVGGFTVMVPRSKITLVDMTIENALTFTLTAGIVTTRREMAIEKGD